MFRYIEGWYNPQAASLVSGLPVAGEVRGEELARSPREPWTWLTSRCMPKASWPGRVLLRCKQRKLSSPQGGKEEEIRLT